MGEIAEPVDPGHTFNDAAFDVVNLVLLAHWRHFSKLNAAELNASVWKLIFIQRPFWAQGMVVFI